MTEQRKGGGVSFKPWLVMTGQAEMGCSGGWASTVVMTSAWLRDKLPEARVYIATASHWSVSTRKCGSILP